MYTVSINDVTRDEQTIFVCKRDYVKYVTKDKWQISGMPGSIGVDQSIKDGTLLSRTIDHRFSFPCVQLLFLPESVISWSRTSRSVFRQV